MKNHQKAKSARGVVRTRIEGDKFAPETEWEDLRLIETFTSDPAYYLIVKGDEDLAASVIADMEAEVYESSIKGDYWIIEIPVE